VFTIVNEVFIILQLVPPLCDYKVWIDTDRSGGDILPLFDDSANMMKEEFYDSRMEKREDERAQKCNKARRVKKAFARGGDKALMKRK
jgi:hypothetical protein